VPVIPFLGPAIAVWILFSLFVMACYFLFVAGHPEPLDELPERNVSPRQSTPAAEPWVSPRRAEPSLPAYDMEDFPPERWSTPAR
jgi:hypothetical protein